MVAPQPGTMLDLTARPLPLITEAQWHGARLRTQDLARVGSSFYLECRLGAEEPGRLDVLAGTDRDRRGALRRWLQDTCGDVAGLRRLSQTWRDDPASTLGTIPALWLELDDVRPSGPAPSASVSACLVPGYVDPLAPLPGEDGARTLPLVTAIVETLTGRPVAVEERVRLERCLTSLPPGGRFIHVSVMLGREAAPIKLYALVPRDALLAFLQRAGWRGPLADVGSLVQRYCPRRRVGDELYVDLTVSDLDAMGGNKLGLVFTPQHLTRSLEPDPGRGPLLEDCMRHGLCTSAQRSALQRWPRRFLTEWTWDGEVIEVVVEQWLDLKLVWDPEAPLALKAYLGLSARGATTFDRRALASGAVARQGSEIGAGVLGEQVGPLRARDVDGLAQPVRDLDG
jgi:hypothetical protein